MRTPYDQGFRLRFTHVRAIVTSGPVTIAPGRRVGKDDDHVYEVTVWPFPGAMATISHGVPGVPGVTVTRMRTADANWVVECGSWGSHAGGDPGFNVGMRGETPNRELNRWPMVTDMPIMHVVNPDAKLTGPFRQMEVLRGQEGIYGRLCPPTYVDDFFYYPREILCHGLCELQTSMVKQYDHQLIFTLFSTGGGTSLEVRYVHDADAELDEDMRPLYATRTSEDGQHWKREVGTVAKYGLLAIKHRSWLDHPSGCAIRTEEVNEKLAGQPRYVSH